MPEQTPSPNGEDLKKLMEENLALTKELLAMTKKVKNYIVWQQVFGFVKILLIAVPIILGIIYLPPLLKQVYGTYQELLDLKPGINLQDLNLPGLQKLLPK